MKKEKRIYSNSYLLNIRTIVFIIWDPRKIKNSHVKLHNVANWLKWSDFFTCWEIRPIYDYMFLRNQKLIYFSFLCFSTTRESYKFACPLPLIMKLMRLLLCADITGIFPAMVEWTERGGPKYSQEAYQLWSAGVNVMIYYCFYAILGNDEFN